jgi:hypothetical protein
MLWRSSRAFVLVAALAACGPSPIDDEVAREGRSPGKADLPGSCASHCGSSEAAPGGCWCDDLCARYGDCCQDKTAICDGSGPGLTPAAPPANDPRFAIDGLRQWYLIGDAVIDGHPALELKVSAPAGTQTIDVWLDGGAGIRLTRKGSVFQLQLPLKTVGAGAHELLLAADASETAFARLAFTRSHPLYVAVTNDWDDPDNPDASLARQETLHARHPELRLTHFVGPYTFTDPSVSTARASKLTDWLKGLRASHQDEIGLHIHPYCSFVNTTAVPCRSAPSFGYAQGDSTGYTVHLDSYSEQEVRTLVKAADQIFLDRGLGKPTSFRAGGWTAELHTLRALADEGYVADGSGCNWSRLEEWKGYAGADLYAWNKEHWSSIGDTSQPYHPSTSGLLEASPPRLSILEVPDNGLLVDYVSAAEMIEVFTKNWPGGALAEPRVYSIGYHPPNFSESFFKRIDDALTHVDRFLASADKGPAVYVTMSEVARAFPKP